MSIQHFRRLTGLTCVNQQMPIEAYINYAYAFLDKANGGSIQLDLIMVIGVKDQWADASAWQSPADISLEKSVKCLDTVSRIPSGSKRPDRCLQATEEQENREDPHGRGRP